MDPDDFDDLEDNEEDFSDVDDDIDYDEEYIREHGHDHGDDEDLIDGVGFADPGGKSALRAATKSNPRNLPCPTCHKPDRLTPADKRAGYQCDECADRAEGGGY